MVGSCDQVVFRHPTPDEDAELSSPKEQAYTPAQNQKRVARHCSLLAFQVSVEGPKRVAELGLTFRFSWGARPSRKETVSQ